MDTTPPEIAVCAYCRRVPVKFRKHNVLATHCSQSCAKKALWEMRREGLAASPNKYTQPKPPRPLKPAVELVKATQARRTCRRCPAAYEVPIEGPGSKQSVCDKCRTAKLGHMRVGDRFVEFESMTRDEVFASKEDSKQPWFYARVKIQKHARARFERSSKPKACVVCGWSEHIEVAHVVGAMAFPGDTTIGAINDLNNLVALCPNHHWLLDAGKLPLDDLEKIVGSGRNV